MADTDDLPGGADPSPPTELYWATLTNTGQLVGAVWAVPAARPGYLGGGAVTHLDTVHPRLEWLGNGVSIAMRSGLGGLDALAEVRNMGGVRWHLGPTQQGTTLAAVRGELMQLDRPASTPVLEVAPEAPEAAPKPRKAPSKASKASKAAQG